MKKLISPLPAGLMPVFKSDLTVLQDNVYAALLALCKGHNPGYSFILQGMVPSISGGTDLVVTEGYWWRHDSNEVIYFAGATLPGSTTGYVAKTGTTTTTKVYKDGSTQNVYEESVSGIASGSLIPFPPTNAIQFTAGATTQDFQTVLKVISNTNTAWANVTFQNSWANNGLALVQYRKNNNGTIYLRGQASHTGASTATIFTLPSGYRPARDITISVHNGATSLLVFIGANGDVIPASATLVYFDGVSFTND